VALLDLVRPVRDSDGVSVGLEVIVIVPRDVLSDPLSVEVGSGENELESDVVSVSINDKLKVSDMVGTTLSEYV
jgi:hypothetical protein